MFLFNTYALHLSHMSAAHLARIEVIMGRNMGLDFGLSGTNSKVCKRKFRWLFKIKDVSAMSQSNGIQTLPPSKSARPSLSFHEMNVKHLNEDVFYPSKPDWKPIQLTLYDLKTEGEHPVFQWIKKIYDPSPKSSFNVAFPGSIPTWSPATEYEFVLPDSAICELELYDGCGNVIETWVYQNAWPQSINFGDLDMGSGDIITCDITLRYVRAYIKKPEQQNNQQNNQPQRMAFNEFSN